MAWTEPTTVAMLQTPGGAGGIAVVLLAGPDAGRILQAVFRPETGGPAGEDRPYQLKLGELRDGRERLDEAIVTVRPLAGRPGAIAAEINIHGGPRVTQRVLALLADAGATIAPDDPELAGRCDVWPLSAEGMENPAIGREMLAAMPRARTRTVLAMLSRQWDAGLSRLAHQALAAAARGRSVDLEALAASLRTAADRLGLMQRLLDPPEVVLAGPPNAGKSTLTNALVGRDVSIVTDVPGTTRDWVRELADVTGRAVWFTDTAGLWATGDPVDSQAVSRAWQRIDQADLVLTVLDAANPPAGDDPDWRGLTDRPNAVVVANKTDLAVVSSNAMPVSAETGAGLPELRCQILSRLGLDHLDPDAPAAFTARQAEQLVLAAQAVERGQNGEAADALRNLLTGSE